MERSCLRIKRYEPGSRSNPQNTRAILNDGSGGRRESSALVAIFSSQMMEYSGGSIVPMKSDRGSNPEDAVTVFEEGADSILCQ